MQQHSLKWTHATINLPHPCCIVTESKLFFCPLLPILDRHVNMSLKQKDNIDDIILLQWPVNINIVSSMSIVSLSPQERVDGFWIASRQMRMRTSPVVERRRCWLALPKECTTLSTKLLLQGVHIHVCKSKGLLSDATDKVPLQQFWYSEQMWVPSW